MPHALVIRGFAVELLIFSGWLARYHAAVSHKVSSTGRKAAPSSRADARDALAHALALFHTMGVPHEVANIEMLTVGWGVE